MYTTFINNIKVDIFVGFSDETQNEEMDKLISKIKIIKL